MNFRLAGLMLLCVILVLGMSCTKLGEPAHGEQSLAVESLPHTGSIPDEWGKLISTSSCPDAKEWIQLWFQDDFGLVRMVAYHLATNTLSDKAVVIRRD